MKKANNTQLISFKAANDDEKQYEKNFQSLLLKINVALNVNQFENLKCKLIYKDGNETKFIYNEIKRFENNMIFLNNKETIQLSNLIDIKF
ncbi:MAG: hypothetical protein ACK50A_17395 [Sphingobacteriaceae bacterium]|jgi:hypothetical protein